jgi:uncharacterized protein (TIGR03437 family)
MKAGSTRFARAFVGSGILLASAWVAGASDIPRFLDRGSKPGPARLDAARQPAAYDLNSLPVYFEKDPAGARFQTRTANGGLLFDTGGFWLGLGTGGNSVRVKFQGARRGAEPAGQQALAAYSNYFIGNDPSQWSTRQHFAGVRYDALWPGVDLVFYAQHRELEYDFNVAPHANASHIRLRVDGADSVTIDEQGELWIATQYGKTKQRRPVIYQEIDGRRVDVAGGYRMAGKSRVGFWLGDYDHTKKLVIDPVLEFSTYLGGSGFDLATAVAVDSSSNIYVTGYTQFADFKTTPAGQRLTNSRTAGPNVFVVKLDATSKQIDYIDFYGGSTYDFPWKITVDSGGYAWVVGETLSSDIPLSIPILSQPALLSQGFTYGFVARFAPGGSLAYSTYTAPGILYGIAVNSAGAAWVVGSTICVTDIGNPIYHEFQPTSGAAQSSCSQTPAEIAEFGYIMRLAPTGSVQYATYYVPAGGGGINNGISDIAVDPQGNAYIAGTMVGQYSVTRAVPSTNGGYVNQQDPNLICEVTKFNPSGQAMWTSTLQGDLDQECLRIASDQNSNVYVTGYTTSQNFPVTAGAFQPTIGSPGQIPNVQENPLGSVTSRPLWDAFAAQFNTNGSLVYSTYLGGNGDDYGFGIAVNSSGNAFVTGYTNSRNFPVTPGAVQTAYGGGQGDAYISGFSSNGTQLVFSTFFGGSGQDEGYQVAIDNPGNVYLAGGTGSTDLPLTSDALQNTVQNADGMIAEFNLQTCDPTVVVSSPVLSAASGTTNLVLTTDVPACPWTLTTTSNWIQFNPASGSGNQTVAMTVTANPSSQSRLAIITANSRRSFVYQAGQTNCQFVFLPGEMALSSNSERQLIFVQTANPTCTWTASTDQPWLHVLASAGGPGSGTVTIGTDQNNTSAARTGHLTVGNQSIVVGQSAGGCVITPSTGANSFGPAGGIGTVTVLTSSSLCAWQAQSQNPDWIQLPATNAGTSYGRGTIRFSVTPNTTVNPRTGTLSVGGQTVTVSQDSQFNSLETLAGDYPSSRSAGTSSASFSTVVRGRTGPGSKTPPHNAFQTVTSDAAQLGNCGSVDPAMPIQMNANGDPVTVTVIRTASGCEPNAGVQAGSWLQVSAPSYPAGSPNVTFTISGSNNQLGPPRKSTVLVNPADSSQLQNGFWSWEVDQAGIAVTPLSIQTPNQLPANAGSDAIPVSSANPSVSACNWSVDPNSVPTWITLNSTTGACGSQLQFSYTNNSAASQRTAILQFTSSDQTELDQSGVASTPCTYSFQETTPQNVGSSGGSVTFNVVTAAGCTWSPSTDSPGWIGFPQSTTGPGPGPLTVQAAANGTTSQQQAQIFVGSATAYVLEAAAASFPTGCVYTLSPTSQSVPNAGGPFSFQVQTTANCTWQPTQPAADASWVHLQNTASVTGPGTVSFTVDANPAGSAARSSSITVAQGVSFAISQDAGPTASCTYTLVPSSNNFTNAGGSFSFQVQTTSNCVWQPSQPASDASWVHLQNTASVTGPGTVNFTVDPNPAGSPARSSSIGVATQTFSISEAAGAGSTAAPTFTAAGVLNGASFQPGGVSPGEIVTVKGSGLGPAQGVSASLVGEKFPTLSNGTQVLFDGVPAPIIYTSGAQVNAIAPYSIAGETSTQVQVVYNGATSSAVPVPVVASAPALFTQGGGTGQGAILNQNTSVNSTSNPAAPGDVVVLFGTGEGQTNPAGVDGQVAVSVYPKPVLTVSVTIGGVNAVVDYAGAAPGLVAGVLQMNVVVPAGLQGSQPVVVTVGTNASPAGVSVALKGTAPPASGTLRASPNPLNVCSATATASVTLSWTASNVTSVKIVTGSLTGAVVASSGPSGSVVVTATPNTQYLLVDTSGGGTPTSANILSTVTLQQGTCPVQASGTLQASPNPLNVCSATATASVTLSWTASNVTSVKIVTGSLTGAVVASSGPSGSVVVTATPNTQYLLVDTSGGGTPTSANILSTVTLQQGTCVAGGPPPTTDLAQSISNWQIQFLYNGAAAGGGAANDTSPSDILDGSSSMYVFSEGADTILLTMTVPASTSIPRYSTWDMSTITSIQISMQSDVPPGDWSAGSPYFQLTSANGSLTLSPTSSSAANSSYTGWDTLIAPLAGNFNWQAATSGQFDIRNVTSIQINLSVAGTNWAVLLNAMFLK